MTKLFYLVNMALSLQGSILVPLLFTIYIFPLGLLLWSLGLNYHFNADDLYSF